MKAFPTHVFEILDGMLTYLEVLEYSDAGKLRAGEESLAQGTNKQGPGIRSPAKKSSTRLHAQLQHHDGLGRHVHLKLPPLDFSSGKGSGSDY